MSEYQCYEFVAVDRQLTGREMDTLRGISTRAEISPARFWNEYNWGNLKADPAELLRRYFDAHLYFTNWGSRRLLLRLPAKSVDVSALKAYVTGQTMTLKRAGAFVVLDFWSDNETRADDRLWSEEGGLAALLPVRSQFMQGDLRAAYVAWLGGVHGGEVDENVSEPQVPPGLGKLPASIAALAKFLRIDGHLLAAAAETSPVLEEKPGELRAWVKALSVREKERWLLAAMDKPEAAVGAELLGAFRKGRANATPRRRRAAGELLARAEALRARRRHSRA